jgi:hypothetical protein
MAETFDEWAVLELMGHRKLAGRVTEATLAGGAFVRLDVFTDGDKAQATQFYAPGAVYCITPTTEANARAFAVQNVPRPVERWELPAPKEPRSRDTAEPFAADIAGDDPNDADYDQDEEGDTP